MRVLLDTVTFLWAVSTPERLSKTALSALGGESTVREISAISLSEIAIKQALGKLAFDKDAVAQGIGDLRLRILPYTGKHAYVLFDLPPHHADPFDRQIIAQALAEEIPVVTADRAFRLYRGVEVLW